MKVIITGSLGNINKPLPDELVEKGPAIPVILSNPKKQKDIESINTTTNLNHAHMTERRRLELELARQELCDKDPVMRSLIDANPNLNPDAWREAQPVKGIFQALLFQIVGQQISVSALHAIYGRLCAIFPGAKPDPETLAHINIEVLRNIGLSKRKAEYVIDLARRTARGELDNLANLSHNEARDKLVALKGIGPWTADGALLIAFGLPDVLVSGDLVMRKAVQQAYGLTQLPTEKEVEAIGERWRPHRSLAAAYLFDSLVPKSTASGGSTFSTFPIKGKGKGEAGNKSVQK